MAKERDAARRAAESYRLFLAGPFIRISENETHEDNARTPAHVLRYYLHKKLTNEGYGIYLGEDVELRLNGQRHYGQDNNAVLFERHHILNHSDGVIILPSSAGSFCEIGDWVSDEKICSSMLVLMDEAYRLENSYINHGIVKFAITNKAVVEYVSYQDCEAALEKCIIFLEKIAVRSRINTLYGRS